MMNLEKIGKFIAGLRQENMRKLRPHVRSKIFLRLYRTTLRPYSPHDLPQMS